MRQTRTYLNNRRVMRCGQDGPYARRTAQAICRYGQAGQRCRRPSWPQPEWDGALWAHLFVGSPRNIDILLRALLLDLHPTSPPSHTCLVMKQVLKIYPSVQGRRLAGVRREILDEFRDPRILPRQLESAPDLGQGLPPQVPAYERQRVDELDESIGEHDQQRRRMVQA